MIPATSPLVQPSLTKHGFMRWRMLRGKKEKEKNELMK
jgi:hypothetical protein